MPEVGTATKAMNVPQMMILSTKGSKIRPNLVTCPYFRAQ